jgi:hypothetical protein
VRDFKDIETKNLCSKWLDATLPSFLREGEDLETVAVKIKIVFSLIDDFGKELCIPFYKQLICLFGLPPCNIVTGQPHPICRNTCSTVLYGPECMEDIDRVQDSYSRGDYIAANFLGGPFPNCSNLPYSDTSNETCTSGLVDLSLLHANSTSLQSEQSSDMWLVIVLSVTGVTLFFLACIFIYAAYKRKRCSWSNVEVEKQSEGMTLEKSTSCSPAEIPKNLAGNIQTVFQDTANAKHLQKCFSDRYLVLPKRTEDIISALEVEDRMKFEDMHEQLRDIAENLGPLLVDLNQIVLHEVLGEGAFGLVQKGTLARDGKLSTVAVKSLKDNSSLSSVLEFVQESCMMSALDHPNILSVSAVCLDMSSGQSALILVPYMANGDLRTFLQKSRYNENTDETVRM